MYSLDINFLKDRQQQDFSKISIADKKSVLSVKENLPIIIGGGIAVLLPGLAGISVLILGQLSNQTQAKIEQLDAELVKLNAQSKSFEEIEAQIEANKKEIQALVTVFNQIKPWSATFQEIENQIPPSVNVESIKQDGLELTISGYALDYDNINDFVLLLQSSKMLQANQTAIIDAKLGSLPVKNQNKSEDIEISYPQVVQYTITTQLTERPASELLQQLDSNGAVGLVRRIKTLEQKGVFKP